MFLYFFIIWLLGFALAVWMQYGCRGVRFSLLGEALWTVGNLLSSFLFAAAAFYSCTDVWMYYREPICSQHYGILGCAGAAALLASVLLGAGMRWLRKQKKKIYQPGIGRILTLAVCLLAGIFLLSSALYSDAPDRIQITAFCRKTVYTPGLSVNEKLSGYVELTNTGRLPVSLEGMYLSAAEDGGDESPLEKKVLQGGQTMRVWLDEMNLDISKNAGNELRLLTADFREVSELKAPKLAVGEYYGLKNGSWQILPVEAEVQPEEPVLSHAGGFYPDAFDLTISAEPGTKIYYTTDGAIPTRESAEYTAPIHIYDPSSQPNRFRNIPNVVKAYWKDFVAPERVDKAFILRTCAIAADGSTSPVVTASYFVNAEKYADKAVVSLVADPDILFGDDGIYVTGIAYTRWNQFWRPLYTLRYRMCFNAMRVLRRLNLGSQDFRNHLQYDFDPELFEPHLNYKLRGDEMEREANFEMYNANTQLSQGAGISIQGGAASRTAKIKRFSVKSNDFYSGSEYFKEPLFPGRLSRGVVINNGSNNALVPNLVQGRRVTAQQSMAVHFFLNGEFWTDSYMLDEYTARFISQLTGIETGRLEVVKIGSPNRATEQAAKLTNSIMDMFARLDLSDDEDYAEVCSVLNVQSYLDFAAVNFYVGNGDFGDRKNYILWRTYLPDENGNNDDRWRYGLYDMDLLIFPGDPEKEDTPAFNPYVETMFYEPMNDQITFSNFMKNPRFRQQYGLTLMDLINSCFTPQAVEAAMAPLGLDIQTYAKGFYLKRAPYAIAFTAQELGIPEEVGTLTLTSDSDDEITLNTLQLTPRTPWQGQYYTAYPVALSTQAPDFDHWEITSGGRTEIVTDTAISVEIQKEGVQVHAVFQK